ncbi:adenylyl-sulfate kinase [Crocinitomix algicola]|uniref:adenylyl-sulfate kinase n=1 Tax=Crocinitomix algicola TaxID=1740263 RepID=UPI00082C5207|nr:adenylyl-sulfate kinase [Crocinitomix algicola]
MKKVIWLTGLSGAGKTTIATNLKELGVDAVFLDGDILRKGLCKDLKFSLEDRLENIRRVAEVARLFIENGKTCVCSFISPTKASREMAKTIIGHENFVEVYVNTPLSICEKRDPKGLYKLAKSGKLKNFTGIDSVYEAPEAPEFVLDCYNESVIDSSQELYNYLEKMLYI